MRTRTLATVFAAVATLMLAACGGGGDPLDANGGDEAAAADTIRVGSANFTENIILAEIYSQALDAAGVQTETDPNVGTRERYLPAMENGELDLVPEYTGGLLFELDPEAEASAPEEVYSALQEALPEGLALLEPSGAEDKDALVVTQETAEEYDLQSIADLEPVAGELVLGGPPEFQDRAQGVPGLQEVYGVEFSDFRELDTGPLSVRGLQDGDVDVANIFTTNPAITENDFVVLEDPENLFGAQNVVPLVNADKATEEVEQTLNAVSEALTTEALTELNGRVDIDNENPDDVAQSWLEENDLL